MNRISLCLAVAFIVSFSLTCVAQVSWRTKLEQELPLLGHRNWIVIADAAYPWQTASGIDTVVTDANQLEVLKAVLGALAKSKHVRPIIYTDAELPFVPEQYAKGIAAYREQLAKLLRGQQPQSLPHEQIIAKLDEAGKTFRILLLKTRLTLPYTSVFLQLDCAYWSAEAERALRQAIPSGAEAKPQNP